MPSEHKYARIEWERRFVLKIFPVQAEVTQIRRMVDRYLGGMRLRLRRMSDCEGGEVFKLTQKLPSDVLSVQQGLISTFYLNREEFEALSALPAQTLAKVRHSVPPFGIDVFEGTLNGLIMAEAEFHSADEAASLTVPSFIAAEVTIDARFTGGSLARATRDDLRRWLAEYGIELEQKNA